MAEIASIESNLIEILQREFRSEEEEEKEQEDGLMTSFDMFIEYLLLLVLCDKMLVDCVKEPSTRAGFVKSIHFVIGANLSLTDEREKFIWNTFYGFLLRKVSLFHSAHDTDIFHSGAEVNCRRNT